MEAKPPPISPPEAEWPPAADLRHMMKENPLPTITPDLCAGDPIADNETVTDKARDVLKQLNEAVKADDAGKLEQCFFAQQAYWRDQIALTWHLRTFSNRHVIAANLLETSALRGVAHGGFQMEGQAHFIPDLVWGNQHPSLSERWNDDWAI